jgi:hypothetical protein
MSKQVFMTYRYNILCILDQFSNYYWIDSDPQDWFGFNAQVKAIKKVNNSYHLLTFHKLPSSDV